MTPVCLHALLNRYWSSKIVTVTFCRPRVNDLTIDCGTLFELKSLLKKSNRSLRKKPARVNFMYTCTKCFDIKEFFKNLIFIKNFSYCKNLIEKYNNYSIIKWNYYTVKENLYHDIVLHHTTHTLLEKKLGCEKSYFSIRPC